MWARCRCVWKLAVLTVSLVSFGLTGCVSYKLKVSDPPPQKEKLLNPYVKIRSVKFPDKRGQHPRISYKDDAIARRLTASFPKIAGDEVNVVLLDVEVYQDEEIPDLAFANPGWWTQGLWPMVIKTARTETPVLKFSDVDGKPLFEERAEPLIMAEKACWSSLPWSIVPAVSSPWVLERTYLDQRAAVIRDAVFNVLDTEKVRLACLYHLKKMGIVVTRDKGREVPPRRPTTEALPPVGQRWAVIVGINKYQYAGTGGLKNLKYADLDAQGVYDQLVEGDPEHWSQENVRLLLDKEATRKALMDAVLGFLKRAQRNDLIVVFFSGHGAPDPARPKNSYFLCYDTDPNRLSTTGFPLWEVQNALDKGIIEAQRVVLFADACHTGGYIPEGMKDLTIVSRDVTEGMTILAKRDLCRVVTSCAAGERSQERWEWGNGHGAFAHALILGLAGGADATAEVDKNAIGNNDGRIHLDELVHYVRRATGDLTANAQHVQDEGSLNEIVKYLPMRQKTTKEAAAPKAEDAKKAKAGE